MAVQQFKAQLDSMGCQDSWAAVAGQAGAAGVLGTASDLLKTSVASDVAGGSVIDNAREEGSERNPWRDVDHHAWEEATNQSL